MSTETNSDIYKVTLEQAEGSQGEEIIVPDKDESLNSKADALEVYWRVIDDARSNKMVNAAIRLYIHNQCKLEYIIDERECDFSAEELEEFETAQDMIETAALLLNRDPDELWKEALDRARLGDNTPTMH